MGSEQKTMTHRQANPITCLQKDEHSIWYPWDATHNSRPMGSMS
jgi:hypothetical protein